MVARAEIELSRSKTLSDAGFVCTIRQTRGDDIDAACGQLVGQVADRTRRAEQWQKSHTASRDFAYTGIKLRAGFEYSKVKNGIMYGGCSCISGKWLPDNACAKERPRKSGKSAYTTCC